jgi:hypothetical protein
MWYLILHTVKDSLSPRVLTVQDAIGLLAPGQRYSTIEGEEACRL